MIQAVAQLLSMRMSITLNYRIIVSHNHNGKPLVAAVALKLASIFGKN